MLDSFHSVVVDVPDFETGVDDYARLLGRAPFRIERSRVRGDRSALFPLAHGRLEIRSPEAAGAQARRSGLAGLRLGLSASEGAPGPGRLDRDSLDEGALNDRLAGYGLPIAEHGVELAEAIEGGGLRRSLWARLAPQASRALAVELVVEDPTFEAEIRVARNAEVPDDGIRALDHVVVLSGDVEATRDFYGGLLGIRLALDRSFEQRGVRLLFFRQGGVTIEVGGRLGAEPESKGRDRFGGLAWQVAAIDAIRSRLLREDFDVSEVRDGHKPGTRVCTVRSRVHDVPTLLIEPAQQAGRDRGGDSSG